MAIVWMLLKWVIAPLLVLAVILALTGKKTFQVEIVVPAPPEAVWAVLMDTGSYSAWNPVFTKVVGPYREGGTVHNTVQAPGDQVLEINASVDTLREAVELRQSGGLPGLLTFDHRWLLEPVEGGTKVTQHEVDRGLFMWFWDSSWIEPSYSKVNEALRNRVVEGAS